MIDLIIKNTSNKIFQMTVDLGIALLEGGNSIIQVCILFWLRLLWDPFIMIFSHHP